MSADTTRVCPPPIEPDDDPAMRARLAAARVTLIGCGGLGSNAAVMLVRSGVRRLTLIDFDMVEAHNLNRQHFFLDQIATPKTTALAETLLRISPDVDVTLASVCVNEDNLLETIGECDVVIEAVDRADVKAMIVSTVLRDASHIPLVGCSGLAGLASANEIVTEQVADNFYLVGDVRSDVRDGLPLLASRVMVAAAHQAHAAIRLLLGHTEL